MSQVEWTLFLLLLTTSASTCLQHSHNLEHQLKPISVLLLDFHANFFWRGRNGIHLRRYGRRKWVSGKNWRQRSLTEERRDGGRERADLCAVEVVTHTSNSDTGWPAMNLLQQAVCLVSFQAVFDETEQDMPILQPNKGISNRVWRVLKSIASRFPSKDWHLRESSPLLYLSKIYRRKCLFLRKCSFAVLPLLGNMNASGFDRLLAAHANAFLARYVLA